MNYSDEQLSIILRNISAVNLSGAELLKVIRDEDIAHGEIVAKANLSKFVADKLITAFIVSGLIKMHLNGPMRFYKITTDGINLLKIFEEEK